MLIADDHDLVRDTIAAFLEAGGGFATETATTLDEALAQVKSKGPFQMVLLDYDMPGMNGLDGLKKMVAANGKKTVALLSGNASRAVAQEAIAAGAIGFVPKTMAGKSLLNTVHFMLAGETYLPASMSGAQEEDEPQHPLAKLLSERERQVLECLSRGLANKEIARELDLQEVTVKLHIKTLSRKLDARNRTHAAMIAKEAGIV